MENSQMMKRKRENGELKLKTAVSILLMLSLASHSRAVQGARGAITDEKQIEIQMNRLASNVNPQELLDPSLPKKDIANQIQHFTGHYQISLIQKGPIRVSGMNASVPVHVIFNTSIGTSDEEKFEENRNLAFVLRDGCWYFVNYNFLSLTPMEYLLDIGLLLIAVIWLFGTWRKFNTLRSRRTGGNYILGLISDYFRAINPLTWTDGPHLTSHKSG